MTSVGWDFDGTSGLEGRPGHEPGPRLRALHADDPRCYWCGRVTVLGGRRFDGRTQSADAATRDHLYPREPRTDPTIPRNHRPGRDVVLACYGCNTNRGSKTVAAMRLWVADRYYRSVKKSLNPSPRSSPRAAVRYMLLNHLAPQRECFEWLKSLPAHCFLPEIKDEMWIEKKLTWAVNTETP